MLSGGTRLSAAQLAELNLPGLPASKRGINMLAERRGWAFTEEQARGGKCRFYSIDQLPGQARAAFEATRAKLVPANLRSVGRPRGSDFFTRNPEVADAVEAILADRQLAAPRILELLFQRFGLNLPSLRTLKRFIAKLEKEKGAVFASIRDPDRFKSRHRISLGRADASVDRAHQVWELDTTKIDVLTKGGRKVVFGVIDRYSRRVRFMVGESESGQAVRRLLVETIRAWGVMPEMVATDNGSGYINRSIVTSLEVLGIQHWLCPPGTPEKKPFVERVFGTFTRERAELLAGYAGHNVAEAQQLRGRAKKETGKAVIVPMLEPEELQRILDAWVDGLYHVREHSSLGTTPMKRWMSSPVPARTAPPEDVLKIALSAYVTAAKVGKRGIRWKGGRYWTDELLPFMDRMVIVRRDEDDLGALFVFDEDQHFIGTAVNHLRAGVSEEAFAREATRRQQEYMKAAKAEIRTKQRAFSFDDAVQSLLRREAENAGKLTTLPLPTVDRSTPQLDSIANAPQPDLPSAARVEEALARGPARPKKTQLTLAEKIEWADRLIEADRHGAAVDPEELQRARLFASSTAYRAEKVVSAAFGAAPASTANDRRQSA